MPLSCTRSACQTVCPSHRRDLGLGYINPGSACDWQTFLKGWLTIPNLWITGWQALHLTFGYIWGVHALSNSWSQRPILFTALACCETEQSCEKKLSTFWGRFPHQLGASGMYLMTSISGYRPTTKPNFVSCRRLPLINRFLISTWREWCDVSFVHLCSCLAPLDALLVQPRSWFAG